MPINPAHSSLKHDTSKHLCDVALRELLCHEIPELDKAITSKNDWHAICLLRDFVYRQVNWGNDGLQASMWFPQGIEHIHPLALLELLRAREISMLCGATSIFL